MFIANHYTRISGRLYARGETIPDNLPETKKNWLLEAGAIREVAPASPSPEIREDAPRGPQTAESQPEDADGDEIDEDAEVPEIDVMDGLVAENGDEQAAKPAAKKTVGRRKTK